MSRPVCRSCGDPLTWSQYTSGYCTVCARERLRRVCGLAEGRQLTCRLCGQVEHVLEAAQGARTDDEHRWIPDDAYECSTCLDARAPVLAVPARPGPSDVPEPVQAGEESEAA